MTPVPAERVQVIDSHTAGEPTRVVIAGGPPLGDGSLQSRLERFRLQYDSFRTAVLAEPRGSDVLVGGLLCEPNDPAAAAGVIFFNDVGYLGMCGHGSIGVITTLAHLGRLGPGTHRIETPVGMIAATLPRRWRGFDHERAQLSLPQRRGGRCAGVGPDAWGHCVGRKLVLPGRGPSPCAESRKSKRADGGNDRGARCAGGRGHSRCGWRDD